MLQGGNIIRLVSPLVDNTGGNKLIAPASNVKLRPITIAPNNQVCTINYYDSQLVAYPVILRYTLLHRGYSQWVGGSWLYARAYITKLLWFIFTARKDSLWLERL